MAWVLKLEEVEDGRVVWSTRIMTLDRPARVEGLEDVGLRLAEGKALLAETQKRIVTRQFVSDRQARSTCPGCGEVRRLKDYRPRRFHTVFGSVVVRRARLKCTRCPRTDDGDALDGHSTPELDSLRAKLAAHLPYRVVGQVLREMLPVSGGVTHTSVRRHTGAIALRLSRWLSEESRMSPCNPAEALTVGLDTAYIRAIPDHTPDTCTHGSA